MEILALSDEALDLLRRRLAGEWVGVTEENRPLYRALVGAGLMEPISTFLSGREGYYRPTEASLPFAARNPSTPTPAPAEALSQRD